MKSVMSHSFSQIPKADIQRSSFDRSHGHKTAFDAGLLVPVYVDEALPGDTFNMSMTGFGRLATPIYPLMDNAYLDIHFFSVPMRQLWDNFRKFMGERIDPADSIDFTVPQCNLSSAVTTGSFEDYIGLPLQNGVSYSDLFARAYLHIFNEWYRDQNLQDSVSFDTDDGPVSRAPLMLLRRGKRHDYFTSCLPWPQKGDAVSVPLGATAPIYADDTVATQEVSLISNFYSGERVLRYDGGGDTVDVRATNSVSPAPMYADLTTATASTINQLRQAFQIQRLLERDARGGTRYAEIVNSHFGVRFMDVTYRPEFLGGGSGMININPVAQTSETGGTTPQGNLSAFGTVGINAGFTKSFFEHCIIFGIASVRADLTYQEGINRMFSRQTRYDFYWPALSHIGEQAVLNKEIYFQNTAADDDVFGYQERYAEYRYKPSIITGIFRSDAAGSLDAWHLSQDFSSLPVLGDTFIQENPPFDRVIAVPSEPHIIFDSYFSLRCARPMPLYGVPGFMDHF
jgi:hypothetical protein